MPSALIKGQTGTAVLGIATPSFYIFSGHETPGNVIIAWWQQDGKKARNLTMDEARQEKELAEFKEKKKLKKAQMTEMQNLPYDIKVRRAEIRAHEFIQTLGQMGLEAHVSVGGLDSITLLYFLRSIGINVPAISVSSLEDRSIQKSTRKLGSYH